MLWARKKREEEIVSPYSIDRFHWLYETLPYLVLSHLSLLFRCPIKVFETFGVPRIALGLLLPQSSGLLLSYTPPNLNSKHLEFGKLEFRNSLSFGKCFDAFGASQDSFSSKFFIMFAFYSNRNPDPLQIGFYPSFSYRIIFPSQFDQSPDKD